MNNTTLSFTVETTDHSVPLNCQVLVDNIEIFNGLVDELQHVTHHLDDSIEIDHTIQFILDGKLSKHTQLNEDGDIVHDVRLKITDLAFDEIPLGQIFSEKAVYTHNFNGTGAESQHRFFGEMGCNGTVTLEFYTPIYLWLLENM
jgi:hypothetical protein